MVWWVLAFSVLLVVAIGFLCVANRRAIKRARSAFDEQVDQFQQRLQKEANEIVDDLRES